MAEITAAAVKSLREKTGAGMMECKNALTEAQGSEEQAIELLRKRGLASAKKKEGRVAAEGAVGSYIHMGGKVGVLVDRRRAGVEEVSAVRARLWLGNGGDHLEREHDRSRRIGRLVDGGLFLHLGVERLDIVLAENPHRLRPRMPVEGEDAIGRQEAGELYRR